VWPCCLISVLIRMACWMAFFGFCSSAIENQLNRKHIGPGAHTQLPLFGSITHWPLSFKFIKHNRKIVIHVLPMLQVRW
jgi:hypothetical protein